MNTYLTVLAALLVLFLLMGLARQLVGQSHMDRIIISQLFGTTGVAIFILLAVIAGQSVLLNVALVLALLAPLTLIMFIRLRSNDQ